ncbi:MAG: type II toxin-antitoxin system VapC family toxin [Deltaproteobacteria bacterium]|nr:type II toxin-antitoxin system VapC family toxin [Deltaproteobacteria bacterium]
MTLVLDASAAAAVLFREPSAERFVRLLFETSEVIVPPIFPFELANVARSKVLRHELAWSDAEALLGETQGWLVTLVDVGWKDAWSVARRHGLTVYDASYLSLAIARDLSLLSLDDALVRAAGKRAVRLRS